MGRNPEQNQKAKDERRRQVLSTALNLFAVKGLAATRIADISSVSGFSQGLVYHYFKSKEEIYTELIGYAFDRMIKACDELEKSPLSPSEKIRTAIEALIRGFDDNEDVARYYLLINQALVSEAIPEAAKRIVSTRRQLPYRVMERIISAGQREGIVKPGDPEAMALVFWTSIKGLAMNKAVDGKKFKRPDPEILLRMFI